MTDKSKSKTKTNRAAVTRRPKTVKRKQKRNTVISGEVKDLMSAMGKEYSSGVVRVASDNSAEYGRVSTGILSIDLCLAGGFKLSRGVMLVGERASGKSTLALITCKRLQQLMPDKVPVWVDIEGSYDRTWARKLGVDTDNMIVVEPESGEQAVDIADGFMRAEETSAVITDSIAFLTPMKEIEESSEKTLMGVHARLVGNYIRKMNNAMLTERRRGHYPLALYINQYRMKLGIAFGDPRTVPGGKALEFATSQQMSVLNKEIKNKEGLVTHNEHSFHITKDKTGGRLKEGKFKLIRTTNDLYPEGYVDQCRTIMAFALKCGMARGKYEVDGLGKFRSFDEFGSFLFKNPEAEEDIKSRIIKFYQDMWGVT